MNHGRSRRGGANLLFGMILAKNYESGKKLDGGGLVHRSPPPLSSANGEANYGSSGLM